MKKISNIRGYSMILAAAATLAIAPILSAAPTPSTGEGLNSLDDQTLAAELSGRGLTHLLDHYFQANHTPEAEQKAVKTLGAIRELRNPNSKISIAEKIQRVRDVANGVDIIIS